MPANTSPIFALTPNNGFANVPANALTKNNGDGNLTSTPTMSKVFTAGANGSWVSKARLTPVATTAATATTQTVARFYLSTVSSGATTGGSDTWLLAEVALAVQTADHSTNPTMPIEVPLGFAIPSGYYIHCSIHAAVAANTNWQATVFGGDF